MLKDSFGGSTKTTFIATISSELNNYSETISTLRYAAVASKVSNCPVVHYDSKDLLIKQYIEEIKRLKDQQFMNTTFGMDSKLGQQVEQKDMEKHKLMDEKNQISEALQESQKMNDHLKTRI